MSTLDRVVRICALLFLSVCLSGCWFVVRFVDDLSLTLDSRFHGRWQLIDGSGELVIAQAKGCALVQFIADDDLLRLCSLGSAGDYVLIAMHDLRDTSAVASAREYTLGVARWHSADRMGLVMLDGKVTLDELGVPYSNEQRDPDCSTRPADEQAQSACTRLLLDTQQITAPAATTLASLYASGCCTDDEDESILRRMPTQAAASGKE
jgi:hypothetical protein